MLTVHQVTKLTGISPRTLQYYDEIGLLKPTRLTDSGYRLYDDNALQKLQQILFYKELGFKLREIREFLSCPDFDRTAAFKKQKELLLMKRNRTDRLIQLLSRLEKGESCMSFKEFDLSDYIKALEDFKNSSSTDITQHWGSVENFNLFIQKVKDDESEVARHAIKQFGSIEKYTEAMKYNLEHFSEIMDTQLTEEVKETGRQMDSLYAQLTSDLTKDISSPEIQTVVQKMVLLIQKNSKGTPPSKSYWDMLSNYFSSDYGKAVTDSKYGAGAAEYIAKAFQYYCRE